MKLERIHHAIRPAHLLLAQILKPVRRLALALHILQVHEPLSIPDETHRALNVLRQRTHTPATRLKQVLSADDLRTAAQKPRATNQINEFKSHMMAEQ